MHTHKHAHKQTHPPPTPGVNPDCFKMSEDASVDEFRPLIARLPMRLGRNLTSGIHTQTRHLSDTLHHAYPKHTHTCTSLFVGQNYEKHTRLHVLCAMLCENPDHVSPGNISKCVFKYQTAFSTIHIPCMDAYDMVLFFSLNCVLSLVLSCPVAVL